MWPQIELGESRVWAGARGVAATAASVTLGIMLAATPAAHAQGVSSLHSGTVHIENASERAIFELLDEVPQRETFHQADTLMEGLRNLSPRRLHTLLVECRSVKVKRLFLWFAERHKHAWLKRLDRKGIDLGSGKRMLVRGGKLDARFNITVPENLDAGG